MTTYSPALLLYIPATALTAVLLGYSITTLINRAHNWCTNNVDHQIHTALDAPPHPSAIEADDYWGNWPHYWADQDAADDDAEDVTDAHPQRIRARIADNECARLRNDLDQWGRPA